MAKHTVEGDTAVVTEAVGGGPTPGPDPEAWLQQATKHTGTWWEVWVDWAGKRSGRQKLAPKTLGNRTYKVRDKAPGKYVMQQA